MSILSRLKDLRGVDKDDLLDLVGLETRRSTSDNLLPALGLFSLGVVVGAGIGFMLAPKSGAELRSDLRARLHRGDDDEKAAAPNLKPV